MTRKEYMRPAIETIVLEDIMEASLQVSGRTGHKTDDWDGREHDFDDEDDEDGTAFRPLQNAWE